MDHTPPPASVPAGCPDIHPDDVEPIDPHAIPAVFISAAAAWRDAMKNNPDAVRALAGLLCDLAHKATAK